MEEVKSKIATQFKILEGCEKVSTKMVAKNKRVLVISNNDRHYTRYEV